MKKIKSEIINTISFVRSIDFVINSFDVTLEKVVGNGSQTFVDLQDLNNLNSCSDFIRLNIDLINTSLEGGEYFLTLSNGGSDYRYSCHIEDYTTTQTGTGVYANTVKFSTY